MIANEMPAADESQVSALETMEDLDNTPLPPRARMFRCESVDSSFEILEEVHFEDEYPGIKLPEALWYAEVTEVTEQGDTIEISGFFCVRCLKVLGATTRGRPVLSDEMMKRFGIGSL